MTKCVRCMQQLFSAFIRKHLRLNNRDIMLDPTSFVFEGDGAVIGRTL